MMKAGLEAGVSQGTESRVETYSRYVPSGNCIQLGSAESGIFILLIDFEDAAQGASVLSGVVVHADVVLTAIFWVRVAGEGAGGHVTHVRAHESSSDLCNINSSFTIFSLSLSLSLSPSFSSSQ